VGVGILRMKKKRDYKIIHILILFSKKKKKIQKSIRNGDYKNKKGSNVDESYGKDNGQHNCN